MNHSELTCKMNRPNLKTYWGRCAMAVGVYLGELQSQFLGLLLCQTRRESVRTHSGRPPLFRHVWERVRAQAFMWRVQIDVCKNEKEWHVLKMKCILSVTLNRFIKQNYTHKKSFPLKHIWINNTNKLISWSHFKKTIEKIILDKKNIFM